MNDTWCLPLGKRDVIVLFLARGLRHLVTFYIDSAKQRKPKQMVSEGSGFGTLVNNDLFSDIAFRVEVCR